MDQARRIAILMGQDLSFCRNVIRGIRAYAIQKSDWVFRNGPADPQIIPYLRDWKPHGIIANLFTRDVARAVMHMRRPVVDTAYTLPDLRVAAVDVDHEAVGRLAAQYYLQRGFVHFGFFGSENAVYSKIRETSFCAELAAHGRTASVCYGDYLRQAPSTTSWKKADQEIGHWLQRLPKPAAVWACNDVPARNLADICRRLGLDIPSQVAVLGVDDDELECPLTSPPLSSIAIPAERIGYEATKLLDRLMAGGTQPEVPLLLPPLGVVTRQSTDTLAIDDPWVVAALHVIRRRVCETITVGDVVREIGCGRRELERHFRAVLGRSVLDEIRRARIERTKEILVRTDLAMPDVARQAGFSNAQRLAVVFGKFTGMSPTEYRRQAKIREH